LIWILLSLYVAFGLIAVGFRDEYTEDGFIAVVVVLIWPVLLLVGIGRFLGDVWEGKA
jgi:hypothetical protein